jgi:hypothetical protein
VTSIATNFRHGAGTINSTHMFGKEKVDPHKGAVPAAPEDGKRAINSKVLPTFGSRRVNEARPEGEEPKKPSGIPRT